MYRTDLRKSQYRVKGLSFEGTQARIHGKTLNSTRREHSLPPDTLPSLVPPLLERKARQEEKVEALGQGGSDLLKAPLLSMFLATGLQELTKESIPTFKHVATVTELISL